MGEKDKIKALQNKELERLEEQLYHLDFSQASDKEKVRELVFNKKREVISMKKHIHLKKLGALSAAVVAAAAMVMQTAFGKEIVDKVIKIVSYDHLKVTQEASEPNKSIDVPEKLKGKLYTKDGKEIEIITAETGEVYTKTGEKIANIDMDTGTILTEAEEKKMEEDDILIEKDPHKIDSYLCFKTKVPSYLPKDYAFDHAELYKDEKGEVKNSKYVDLYFKNVKTGKNIILHERFADEETACETGTDGTLKEVQLGTVTAVLMDDRNLEWEADGLIFSYTTKGNISTDELIKSAASIK